MQKFFEISLKFIIKQEHRIAGHDAPATSSLKVDLLVLKVRVW